MNLTRRQCTLRVLFSLSVLLSFVSAHVANAEDDIEEMTIAYVGEDGNIWVVALPDQEQTQVTTDGSMIFRAYGHMYETEYRHPAWSADGSKLTFSSYGNGTTAGIHYWDGTEVHTVPGTEGCERPKFSPDGTRIFFNCPGRVDSRLPQPADASTDPLVAIIASAKLDGSGLRAEITYANEGEPGIPWLHAGEVHVGQLMDIDHDNGNILIRVSTPSRSGYAVFAQDGTPITTGVSIINNIVGPWDLAFSSDGKEVVASYCSSDCTDGSPANTVNQVKAHAFDGSTIYEFASLSSNADILGFDIPPGADYVIASVLVSDETPPFIVRSDRSETASDLVVLTYGAYPAVRPVMPGPDDPTG